MDRLVRSPAFRRQDLRNSGASDWSNALPAEAGTPNQPPGLMVPMHARSEKRFPQRPQGGARRSARAEHRKRPKAESHAFAVRRYQAFPTPKPESRRARSDALYSMLQYIRIERSCEDILTTDVPARRSRQPNPKKTGWPQKGAKGAKRHER